ncbi:solute:sodium symporter family transporter [Garciella nitratireducens]|uniref:Solute:Na+ symporter, SSS family n=1 Tax=Garciella nitratireducens DSM 15102 TaxID=1121911 RepID=A0A1T4LN94_9FIRM|nr:solute:sodium symporter family transporter [Garciella nitratireducens]SJZ55998.1 solute:Na+ symporter, SSS family [Garciella nitratireducens DSM 15102]
MSLFSIISFLIIVAIVWIFAFKKSREVNIDSSEGFFMGGRSLTGITIAGTIIMTNLSTEQIVGQNGQSYVAGMEVMAWEVTAAIACVFLAFVFLPKYLKYGVNTISDFIEIRYDTTTKRLVSLLFIITYMISFLPVVLYSGSLVFNQIFHIDEIIGVNPFITIILIASFIGIVGLLYLLMGGMRLSAFSDTIYGIGLIIGGLSIPILGLIALGDGSFIRGIETVIQNTPEKLNSIGAVDSDIVPWPTLFTGMLFNNVFFWCTNQMIVQKALAGKNLKEGQKGALYVGFFKIFGALFLVFPGIIAFNIFGNSISSADNAYPILVATVLPKWAYGVFAAVIFGAILSSFVGSLNSTATLFTLDFYKPIFKKDATDSEVTRAGKMITIIVGLISIFIAPLISFAPSGLYAVVQQFNGIYNMPLLVIILLGFYSKKATAFGAKITIIFHIIFYGLSKVLLSNIHYLYVLGGLFFVDLFVMFLIAKIKPLQKKIEFQKITNETNASSFEVSANEQAASKQMINKVDLTSWEKGKWIGALVIICMIGMYVVFSPLGVAQ